MKQTKCSRTETCADSSAAAGSSPARSGTQSSLHAVTSPGAKRARRSAKSVDLIETIRESSANHGYAPTRAKELPGALDLNASSSPKSVEFAAFSGSVDFLRQLEVLQAQSKSHILVSLTQRGNPLLKHFRDVPWKFGEFRFADFLLGSYTCAFFLSMKFHLLRPDYIYDRVRKLGRRSFRLRILLLLMDSEGGVFFGSGASEDGIPEGSPLAKLEKMCLIQELTLMVAWNLDEAARILESYKVQEGKASDSLQGPLLGPRGSETRIEGSGDSVQRGDLLFHRAAAFLTNSRAVNRADAAILLRHFGSLRRVLTASAEELASVPGIGPLKSARLHKTFHEPLVKDAI
jgi:DNA excision repair protein ERCC-1